MKNNNILAFTSTADNNKQVSANSEPYLSSIEVYGAKLDICGIYYPESGDGWHEEKTPAFIDTMTVWHKGEDITGIIEVGDIDGIHEMAIKAYRENVKWEKIESEIEKRAEI